MGSFREILAAAQFVLTGVSGGVGLWQRVQILNEPFLDGATNWDTTARFHVWPWPYKFAAVANTPALLGSLPFSSGIAMLIDGASEFAEMIPCLLQVPVLWYWVGGRLEQRSVRARCLFLLLFLAAAGSGARRTPT